MVSGPLEGFRIIDVCRTGPGRSATGLLADYGAELISVVDPRFDERRVLPRPGELPGRVLNPGNRRALLLNLQAEGSLEVFYRLVKTADALLESNRPGVAQKLGVDYESVRKVKPDIVYCSLAGYGQEGPYRSLAGHDINYQAIGGMLPQDKEGRPFVPHYADADKNAAWNGTIALLMGLLNRTRTGKGQFIDVAFSDSAFQIPPGRMGIADLNGEYPGYNIYQCQDGEYISLGIIEPWFWERLCRTLGREDLIPHQRPQEAMQEEMMAFFRETFRTKTQAEWFQILREADVEVAPVHRTTQAVVNDPHNRARGIALEMEDATTGEKWHRRGLALNFSDTPAILQWGPAPQEGDTKAILRELGYSEAEIAQLSRLQEGAPTSRGRSSMGVP